MLALGGDPGIAECGLSVVDCSRQRPRLLTGLRVVTSSNLPTDRRVEKIAEVIWSLVKRYRDIAVVGTKRLDRAQAGQAAQGRFTAAVLHVHRFPGLLQMVAVVRELPYFEFETEQVKRAFGHGSTASKKQMVRAAQHMCEGVPERFSHHAADATAAAIAAARRARMQGAHR